MIETLDQLFWHRCFLYHSSCLPWERFSHWTKKDCPSSLRFWRDTSKKARETNVNGRKTEEGGREEKKLGQTQGETAHRSRDTGRKGEMSPKLQRVFVSLRMVGDSSRKSRGGNLSSSFKWPIDHSSRPFLQSNVDVQISEECEGRGGPATRDSGQLGYDLQLRQSTGQGSRQNSGVQCQSRRRKHEIRYRVQGKANPETDADTADRKYAEERLSHVVPHICRRPH